MTRVLASLAFASALCAQSWQLSLPASTSTGDLVTLRLTREGLPVAGVTVRVTAPAREIATVKPDRLPLSDGQTSLFKGDTVLVVAAGETGENCEVILASSSRGVVPCDGLDRRAFGQPLGTTDADGRLASRDLAAVPARIELAAERAGDTVATAALDVQPFQFDETFPLSPGVTLRSRRWVADGQGPFVLNAVEITPSAQTFLLPVRAADRAIGTEPVSNLSRRYGALAAINGAAFVSEGSYAGAAEGPYVWNRRLISTGSAPALVVCADRRLAIEEISLSARVTAADGQTLELAGLNRPRGENEAILYTPLMGELTLTGDDGVEAQLDLQDRVNELSDGAGNSLIPFDGRVVSGHGTAAEFLRQKGTAGSLLRVEAPLPNTAFCQATDVVPGAQVSGAQSDPEVRRPRAAFALTEQGTWLMATADGAQASTAGMRLDEFESELKAMGAIRILPLAGGEAATLTINDALRNRPAGGEGDLPVGDAIMVFQVNDFLGLLKVLDRILSEPGQVSQTAVDTLDALLNQAAEAFVDGDPAGVRQIALQLRDTVTTQDGAEIRAAAARVMLQAVETFITTLPEIQPLNDALKPRSKRRALTAWRALLR